MKKLFLFLLLLAGKTGFAQVQYQYLDSSFHYNGLQDSIAADSGLAHAGILNRMVVQPDGKVLVAITKSVSPPATLLRLNANGTPATSFGIGGFLNNVPAGSAYARLQDMIVQPDGKILLRPNGKIVVCGGVLSTAPPALPKICWRSMVPMARPILLLEPMG